MRPWGKVCLLNAGVSVPTGNNNAIYTPRSEPCSVQPASPLSRAAGESHLGGPRLAPHINTPAGLGKVSSRFGKGMFQWSQLLSFLLHLGIKAIILQIRLCHVGCHGSLFTSQITHQQQCVPHRRNITCWNIGSA